MFCDCAHFTVIYFLLNNNSKSYVCVHVHLLDSGLSP